MSLSDLLSDDCTVGSIVCSAAEKLLGEGWLLWEPETIWTELRHRGIDMPLGNRQQLLAGRAVITTGRVFYDALVFDRTAAAMANDLCDYDGYDDAVVAQYAWCVDEVAAISELVGEKPLEYDREIEGLVARKLREEGFVLAPPSLEFAQARLDRSWGSEASDLKRDVLQIQAAAAGLSVRNIPYPETPRGVQMARLASVAAFLEERRETRLKQRASLLSSSR